MRFLVDENVSPCLKFILDVWGHDAQAVNLRHDLRGEPDEVVMSVAATEGRIVVSFNVDHYRRLHEDYQNAGHSHPGIIVCTQQEGYERFGNVVTWMGNLLATVPESALRNDVHYLHTY